jgi:hypothetical protein
MRWNLAGTVLFGCLVVFGVALALSSELLTQAERLGLVMFFAVPLGLHLLAYALRNPDRNRHPHADRAEY